MIKILVTGPNSYFSYNLLTKLINQNLDLFIIIRNKKELKKVNKRFNYKFNNYIYLNEIINTKNNFKYLKFDFIINTITKYDNLNNSFKEIFESNVEIPTKLFRYGIKSKSGFFINLDTVLNKESNFYALTKYIFRKIIREYVKQKNVKIINIQFHNFYSYNQNENNLISKLMKFSKLNKKFHITKGSQIRDFIHIDDATNLIIEIIKNKNKFSLKNSFNFNIGGNQHISIKDLSNKIRKHFHSNIKLNIKTLKYKNKFTNKNYFSENYNLPKFIKWEPKHNLRKFFKN